MQILHEVNNVNLRDSELLTAVLDMNCIVFYVKAIKREWIYSSFNDMIGRETQRRLYSNFGVFPN